MGHRDRSPGVPRTSLSEIVAGCLHLPPPQRLRVATITARVTRAAATLLPLVDLDGEAGFVVTRRSAGTPTHPGDWVFPGGGAVAHDASAAATAIRETSEELGVPPARIAVHGELDSHGPIDSGHLIRVFVGVIDGTQMEPDPREVDRVAVVPFSSLSRPGAYFVGSGWPEAYEPGQGAHRARLFSAHARTNKFIVLDSGELLWGLQAEILLGFLQAIGLADLVAQNSPPPNFS